MEKKKSQKTVMDKTIEDNLLRRKVLEEEARKEREDDIRIMEDVTVLDIINEKNILLKLRKKMLLLEK